MTQSHDLTSIQSESSEAFLGFKAILEKLENRKDFELEVQKLCEFGSL